VDPPLGSGAAVGAGPGVTEAGHSGMIPWKASRPNGDATLSPMRRPIRLTTVFLLLVASMVAGLLPAAGSWSCPDGTTCVYTRGRGYHCLGDRCQMACCAAKKPTHCCGCCGHGPVPGVTTSAGSHEPVFGQPAHCRYHRTPRVETAWVRVNTAPDLQSRAAAVLPTPVELPVVCHVWERLAPIRGSPSSSLSTPPSSPRAPPGPDCT
jgi:hypothetical protein